jgi:WD40 repeat protein
MQDTYALLSDVVRLAAAYQVPVTASALQVYHSTVVTMPSCRLQELASKDDLLPVLISERPSNWQSTLEGHSGWVYSVAFSYDGQYVVSGSKDGTVRLWDTATGILLQMMNDHEGPVRSVAFSGHGRNLRIVSGSNDCTMRIWDAITGFHLRTINHAESVLSVAASRNGQLLVSGSSDHAIRVWDVLTGALRHVMDGHSDKVCSVAFSSDSKLVVSGSVDCTLRVWDAATGMQQLVVGGHQDGVQSTAFLREDRCIVSGPPDNTIRVWSVDTGAPVLIIQHDCRVYSLAVLHNEDLIASGTDEGTILLWDATTGHCQRLIVTGYRDWITSIAISADSKFVAVGYRNGPLWMSEMTTPTLDVERRNQTAHTKPIMAFAFSSDGLSIASGSHDCMAKVWSAKTGLELSTMSGHTRPITSVALSGDGKLVVSGSSDRTVRLWEATTGTELHVFAGHKDFVFSVALSGDNKLIASGSGDRTVRVWDVVAGTHLYTIRDHKDTVISVAFSNDSSFIASGSWDGTILMCDTATGTHQQTITGPAIGYIAFSNDGSYIFSRPESADDTMQVWEVSKVIPADGASLLQDVEAPDSLCCDQFKIDRDGWVSRLNTRKSWQRLCWLPTERRSSRTTRVPSFGQTVCIGAVSGAVTILDFSHVRIPY